MCSVHHLEAEVFRALCGAAQYCSQKREVFSCRLKAMVPTMELYLKMVSEKSATAFRRNVKHHMMLL